MVPEQRPSRDGRYAGNGQQRANVSLDAPELGVWPAVETEEVRWVSKFDGAWPMTHAERALQRTPYRAAITPEIATLRPMLAPEIAALADEASVEIARFDAEMGSEIAPFSAVLLRSESASSSQIEHLTAPAKAIALAELGDRSKRTAREIVGNVRSMTAANHLADNIDSASVLAMHDALLSDTHPGMAGEWRTEPVWIGGGNQLPHLADFIPPRHERVPGAVEDLMRFAARDDISVLTQAAIAHAQFETIHPFPDGNGRTGRALLHAMLRNKGLTRDVTVPISAGLLTDTDGYFAALTAYRNGDINPITETMALASFLAIGNGRVLVGELREIRVNWAARVNARRDSAVWKVLDALIRQPVVDTAYLQSRVGLSSSASHRAVEALESAGVVKEFSGMRRNRCWRSDEVLRALDAFAARSGRRVL